MDLRSHLAGFRTALEQRRKFDPAIPAISGQPVIGSLAAFRRDAFDTLRRAGDQGDLVRLDMAYKRVCLTKHPDAIATLLESPDAWERTTGLAPLLGKNVLTTVGEEWSANRQMAQPSFHQKMAGAAAAEFAKDAAPLIEAWGAHSNTIDVALEAMRLFALLAPRGFGMPLRADEAHKFPMVVQRLQHWGFKVVAGGQPRSRQVEEDLAFLYAIIDRALDTPAPAGAPPSFLERIRQDRQIERDALRGHLLLMLIASADNPPNTFAFTIWILAQYPAWADSLRAELAAAGPGELSTDEIDALPILDRVLQESMRIYPPVWFLARVARRDTELLGHRIPAGTMAFASTWHAHRHSAFWDRPDSFDPDRFLPQLVEKRHRHAYVPFGAGQRRCIGSRIARLEIKVLLALFLRRFRVQPGAAELPLEGTFALRARGGVPVRLEKLG